MSGSTSNPMYNHGEEKVAQERAQRHLNESIARLPALRDETTPSQYTTYRP